MSFPQLPLSPSPLSSPIPSTHSILSPLTAWADATSAVSGGVRENLLQTGRETPSEVTPHTSTASSMDTTEGGYLGRFTTDKKGMYSKDM